MSLCHSVGRTLLCRGCRTHLVQPLTSTIRHSPSTARQSRLHLATPRLFQTDTASTPVPDVLTYRTEASSTSDASEDHVVQDVDVAIDDEPSSVPPTPRASTTSTQSNSPAIPWYLQVDPPIAPQASAISERQRLPDLPIHSPDLLQPILEHVSVDLGIDDLTLLDLRTLDPPPALGANLIMIIGTARSEKHLHVSADRLCRWLRSQYHMSPFADGLLGRNELKLKLRRKAKRSRLLSAVGAKETATEMDDGIRTGWVCVNVGKVQGGILPEQQEQEERHLQDASFVGFGTQSTSCRIVVQMMTEEKRGLMDLETLWNGIMRRATQKLPGQNAESEAAGVVPKRPIPVQDTDESILERPLNGAAPTSLSAADHTVVYRPASVKSVRNSNAGPRIHARAFHTFGNPPSRILDHIRDKGALPSRTTEKS